MRPKRSERGAALLAVLILVAITGAIAAAALEKMQLSRAAALNMAMRDQAQGYATGLIALGRLIVDDLVAATGERTTLDGGWNGGIRRVPLPNGSIAEARLTDGGNCFNLNSVVLGAGTAFGRRQSGVEQFVGLMLALRVPESDARRVAEAAADWADSGTDRGPGGAEDSDYASGAAAYRTGNTLFADESELMTLQGMTPELYATLRPWVCVLPSADMSPINVNTLTPEQAPLLAMLAPGQIGQQTAAAIIAARPRAGWASPLEFWQQQRLSNLNIALDVQLQPQVRTRWFALDITVAGEGLSYAETALIDARGQPSRVAMRRIGSD